MNICEHIFSTSGDTNRTWLRFSCDSDWLIDYILQPSIEKCNYNLMKQLCWQFSSFVTFYAAS